MVNPQFARDIGVVFLVIFLFFVVREIGSWYLKTNLILSDIKTVQKYISDMHDILQGLTN